MDKKDWIIGAVAGIALVIALVVGVGGKDQSSLEKKVDLLSQSIDNILGQVQSLSSSANEFGSSGTRFPNGISADSTSPNAGQVRGTTLTVTGTTTVQELTYGSRFSTALSFATPTTSGTLAAIQNTGSAKLCGLVELDITTAGFNQFDFAVGTSTAATTWSAGYANGLVASSLVATDTPRIITNLGNKGVNAATTTWKWNNGDYLLAGMNTRADKASTTDWATMAGKMYVTCHTL